MSSSGFEIHQVRQYLVKFPGMAGKVNATLYNTELILIGLGDLKLSKL